MLQCNTKVYWKKKAKFTSKLWFNIAVTAYCKNKQFCPFKMNFSSVACYKKQRDYGVSCATDVIWLRSLHQLFIAIKQNTFMFETGSPLGVSCKATLCKLAHAYASTYLNTHTYVCFAVCLYARINIYICVYTRIYILFVDHMLNTPCHTRNTYH